MDINVEYKNQTAFERFFDNIRDKRVLVLSDVNTKPYADEIVLEIERRAKSVVRVEYEDEELIPDETNCERAYALAKDVDYVLAVGSGTLNDMAKSAATRNGALSGVLCTAASMDGYCSKGAALMRGGRKVTDEVNAPSDVLIDLSIICNAPKLMTASGFGDIVGKYTCLTDWRMANAVKGEAIHAEAYSVMEKAVAACMDAFDGLTRYEDDAIAKLMNALITAGVSMAICGNSRPASGSEHHQSHFLETDFIRRGERVPLHGLKVAIGTLVSIESYNFLKDEKISFNGAGKVYELVDELPKIEDVKSMLEKMGCPTRFSALGVRRETMEEMIEKAYTMRDRYTVLTLIHELGLTERVKPILMEKYY